MSSDTFSLRSLYPSSSDTQSQILASTTPFTTDAPVEAASAASPLFTASWESADVICNSSASPALKSSAGLTSSGVSVASGISVISGVSVTSGVSVISGASSAVSAGVSVTFGITTSTVSPSSETSV